MAFYRPQIVSIIDESPSVPFINQQACKIEEEKLELIEKILLNSSTKGKTKEKGCQILMNYRQYTRKQKFSANLPLTAEWKKGLKPFVVLEASQRSNKYHGSWNFELKLFSSFVIGNWNETWLNEFASKGRMRRKMCYNQWLLMFRFILVGTKLHFIASHAWNLLIDVRTVETKIGTNYSKACRKQCYEDEFLVHVQAKKHFVGIELQF